MLVNFVGLKHVSGTSSKTGKNFAFDVACLTSEMEQRDKDKGAKGLDVHTPTIPDRWSDVFSEKNIGKQIIVEFYYSNGRENIGYASVQ